MQATNYILIALALWNLIVMGIYALDKRRAQKKKRRISEKTLLLCALLSGGVGALIGVLLFRHKTKHIKFIVSMPIACIATIALAWLLINAR